MAASGLSAAARAYLLIFISSLSVSLLHILAGFSFREKIIGNAAFFLLLALGYYRFLHGSRRPGRAIFLGYAAFVVTSYLLFELAWAYPDARHSWGRVLAGFVERTGYYPPLGDTPMFVGIPIWAVSVALLLCGSILLVNLVAPLAGARNRLDER